MARPSVQHSGFLIPNAKDVSDTVLAEPDQIDFNTLANARWGVVSGCALGEQGPLALTVGVGVAVVNGALVPVRGGTVSLTLPNTGSRFINVVVDSGGVIRTIDGVAATDPVFPDVPVDNTLLATCHATANAASLQDFVVDKRRFLTPALFSNVGALSDLIVNYNSPNPPVGEPSQWWRVNGQGDILWSGDTLLKRSAAKTLRITDHLVTGGDLTVEDDAHVVGALAVDGVMSARNLRRSNTRPTSPVLGDLWQDTTNGTLSIALPDPVTHIIDWEPLATGDTAMPVGTIIDSVETKTIMESKGWVALDGSVVTETKYPNLFGLVDMAPWISGGTAPTRQMTLPNMNRRFRITDNNDTAKIGGSNTKVITRQNLPKHDHNVSVDTHGDIQPTAQLSGTSGAHGHDIIGDGKHDHDVYDRGHTHDKNFIVVNSAGGSMLDGLINDRSHTWQVDVASTTATGYANIVAKPAAIGGLSIPTTGGLHNHTVQVSKITGLTHTVREELVGENTPIDITPAYFTVRTYIRT